jgi:hypothetical protein|tara:strand:+ start:297 stop:500 length:204 start_codon:yes stop_codon:yes gene_type:complete
MKSLLFKIGIGVSVVTNIFFIGLASYTHLTQDIRVKENREFMKKVIQDEVYKQIEFVMPSSTGTVVK